MLTKSTFVSWLEIDFGTVIQKFKNAKRGIDMTEEELRNFINSLPKQLYCNEVMGVSCGDGGAPTYDPSVNPWNLLGPFDRWDLSGGMCPAKDGEVVIKRSYCSSGCADFFGKCK
jgi:hypothetical protein